MLEPVVNPRAITDLAGLLIDRAAAGEPAIHAERDLFEPLARAYFRDRGRALAGAAPPLTTLMLETARTILDHLIDEAVRSGGPFPATPARRLRGDAGVHRVISGVLTEHLPPDRADRLADALTGTAAPRNDPAVIGGAATWAGSGRLRGAALRDEPIRLGGAA
jgi:hypothetical protein